MALAFAAVAGTMALLLGLRTRGMAAFLPLVLRLAVPTMLVTGWFYVWNLHRFDNVAGPYATADDLGGGSGPSLFDLLTGPEVSVKPFAYIVTDVYGRRPWWWEYHGPRPYLIAAVAVGVVITAIVLAARGSSSLRPRRHGAELSLAAWICCGLLALVPIVLTAYHVSRGGASHPRYLFPILPIVAAATALVASRVNRWLAVVVVGAFALAQITRLRAADNLHDAALSITPPQLHHSPIGQPFLALSVAIAMAGAVVLLVAWFALRVNLRPSSTDGLGGSSASAPASERH